MNATDTTPSLAAGASIASRYLDLGMPAGNTTLPLSLMSSALVGPPNSGKSYLIQSCADGLVLNIDMSTSVYRDSQVLMTPLPNPADGRPLGPGGVPITLDWDFVLRIKKALIDKATSNLPRPRTVFIDSLSSAVRLLFPWVIARFSTPDRPKYSWNDIDGRAGWEMLYSEITSLIADLRRVGYGVCSLIHIENKFIPIGEDQHKSMWEVAAGPSLWRRLYTMLDMVAPVMSEMASETVMVPQPPATGRDGKPIARPDRAETRPVRRFFATFTVPELAGIAKPRSLRPLGVIQLPERDGWAALEAAIAEANRV